NHPANVRVATLFGPQGMNVIDGYLAHEGGTIKFRRDTRPGAAEFTIPTDTCEVLKTHIGDKILCGIRPEDVEPNAAGELRGEVTGRETTGDATYICVRLECLASQLGDIVVRKSDHGPEPYRIGEEVRLRLNPQRLHWFAGLSGDRIPKT